MTNASPDEPSWSGSLLHIPRHLPRLTPDLEQRFQAEYYARIHPSLLEPGFRTGFVVALPSTHPVAYGLSCADGASVPLD